MQKELSCLKCFYYISIIQQAKIISTEKKTILCCCLCGIISCTSQKAIHERPRPSQKLGPIYTHTLTLTYTEKKGREERTVIPSIISRFKKVPN